MKQLSEVYILVDASNRIIAIDGGYTINNVDKNTWILIDGGYGDRYNLCQTQYLEKPLYTEDGFYRYKWTGSYILERTEEEIEADREASTVVEPSIEDRLSEAEQLIEAQNQKIEYLLQLLSQLLPNP